MIRVNSILAAGVLAACLFCIGPSARMTLRPNPRPSRRPPPSRPMPLCRQRRRRAGGNETETGTQPRPGHFTRPCASDAGDAPEAAIQHAAELPHRDH